jgi:hypothetical protein
MTKTKTQTARETAAGFFGLDIGHTGRSVKAWIEPTGAFRTAEGGFHGEVIAAEYRLCWADGGRGFSRPFSGWYADRVTTWLAPEEARECKRRLGQYDPAND